MGWVGGLGGSGALGTGVGSENESSEESFRHTLAKDDTVEAPRRCDSYRPQGCDETRMWLCLFFPFSFFICHERRLKQPPMSNVDNLTLAAVPLMGPRQAGSDCSSTPFAHRGEFS